MVSIRLVATMALAFLLFQSVLGANVVRSGRRGRRDGCFRAFRRCDFRFQGISGLPTFSISGPADRAFTPRVISTRRNQILGVLNTNDVISEFVFPDGGFSPITNFGSQRFTPTAFKPFSIPRTTGSGVGHETFQGNQLQVARGRCVRVFFTSYQLLFRNGNVSGNINDVPRSMNSCVVFRTR